MSDSLTFFTTVIFLTVGYIFYVSITHGDGVAFAAFVGAVMFCVGKMYEIRKYTHKKNRVTVKIVGSNR